MKFACNSFIAPGETWQKKFANLEKLGFDGIEVRLIGDEEQQEQQVNEIVLLAKNSKIKPCSLVRPTLEFAKELTEETLTGKINDVAKTAEFAARIGVPTIVSAGVCVQPKLPSPFLPVPIMDSSKRILLRTYLTEVGKIAVQNKANLLIEPLNRYEGNFYHKLSEATEILNEVGNDQFGILADVFHINIEEANTEQAILGTKGWIKHVQLGDNNRLLPGEGQFDFRTFFYTLKKIKYSGFLALECIAPLGKLEPLQRCIKFLRNLQNETGW